MAKLIVIVRNFANGPTNKQKWLGYNQKHVLCFIFIVKYCYMSQTFPHHLRGDARTKTTCNSTVIYTCTGLLATLHTASRLFASVSTRCARNQFPHHSLLVDSRHCMWNCVRQSYGLTYYSLRYTLNRLLVTSQPISHNMLMTDNYYVIRLYNIENVSVSPNKG